MPVSWLIEPFIVGLNSFFGMLPLPSDWGTSIILIEGMISFAVAMVVGMKDETKLL